MTIKQKVEPCKFEYKRIENEKIVTKQVFEAGDVKSCANRIFIDKGILNPSFDPTSFMIMLHTGKPILTNSGWEQIKILK